MNRDINPVDVLIGLLFGVAIALLTLRLGGMISPDIAGWVALWGTLSSTVAIMLGVARQVQQLKRGDVIGVKRSREGDR